MSKRTAILGIDIQNDFTLPSGALYVNGADADVKRMATFIDDHSSKIDFIALTLDSHQPIHIANQHYWEDFEGYPPALFTVISADEVESGKWKPLFNKEMALPYLRELEKKGEVCTIWPTHCIQGSKGWAVNEILVKTLYTWSISVGRNYQLYYKGSHQATEHYSIFKAAVEYADAIETQLNTDLLAKLESFDNIIFMGEAADYCVANSLKDMLDISPSFAEKIIIFTDCMSWINEDNERALEIYEWAQALGVRFMTSNQF